jgi:hypothetical protein
MNPAPFLIDGDKGRLPACGFPQGSAQAKNLFRFTAVVTEKNESTERILFDDRFFFMDQPLSLKAHDEHLTELFFERRHGELSLTQVDNFWTFV